MNKNFTKTLIVGLACITLCGTTFAVPQRVNKAPQKAPMQQKVPAQFAKSAATFKLAR